MGLLSRGTYLFIHDGYRINVWKLWDLWRRDRNTLLHSQPSSTSGDPSFTPRTVLRFFFLELPCLNWIGLRQLLWGYEAKRQPADKTVFFLCHQNRVKKPARAYLNGRYSGLLEKLVGGVQITFFVFNVMEHTQHTVTALLAMIFSNFDSITVVCWATRQR